MAGGRVVLHVGTPKSGTTYLQDLLHASAPSLAEAGVLFPGTPADHFRAAVELTYGNFHGHVDPAVPGAWRRLVDAARDHDGTTVISHELFGDLSATAADRVLADLAPARVDVVVTARDLARQIPAVWQEDVKNRHLIPLADLLELLRPGSRRPDVLRPGAGCLEGHAATFWLRQDLPAVLRRWGAGRTGGARVHLVTVPPRNAPAEELWRRFAAVLGVDPGVAALPAAPANASLGLVATEVLRAVNAHLDHRVGWERYRLLVPDLVRRAPVPAEVAALPLLLPAAARPWVAAQAEALVSAVSRLAVPVTGDLGDLRVPPAPDQPPAPDVDAVVRAVVADLLPRLPDHDDVPAPVPVRERADEHPATAAVTGPSVAPVPRRRSRTAATVRSWRPWTRPAPEPLARTATPQRAG